MGWAWKAAAGTAAVLAAATGVPAGSLAIAGANAAQGVGGAQAKASLLRIGDFPQGWKASKAAGSTNPTTVTRAVSSCERAPTSRFPPVAPDAASPQFTQPDQALTVTEAVSVYASAASASRHYAAYSSTKAPRCLLSYFRHALHKHAGASGVTAGQPSGSATPFPRYANATTAFHMTVPVSVKGFTGSVEVEAVVVRKAASLAYLTMTSVGSPFPGALAHQLAATAAKRLHG